MGTSEVDMKLEVVFVPVSDVERAAAFYRKLGWRQDADTGKGDERRLQFTPPGSGCSIIIRKGVGPAVPGTTQFLHLVVSDIVAARAELMQRGAAIGAVRHMVSGEWRDGPHPERENYQSFADFTDPDGNIWLLQEVDRTKA